MNSKMFPLAAVFLAAVSALPGQVSSNASLAGKYFFRHVLLVTDGGSGISETRTAAGILTFDGSGAFTYLGEQLVGTNPSATLSGSGTYTVKPGGVATLTSPLRAGTTINARLGVGALVGAATEAGATVFDLFIAIPAPSTTLTNAALTGPYLVSSLEFPTGGVANVRNTNFKITANGAGAIAETSVTGQARNLGARRTTQTISPITYLVSPDATGVLNFPTAAGLDQTTQLIAGAKLIYVSQDGSYFIGGSLTTGAHGLLVGVKAFSTPPASNANFKDFYFNAGLRFDADRTRLTSTVGAVNATTVGGAWGRRTRQSDGLFDASTVTTYVIGADGAGSVNSSPGSINIASSGALFTTSGLDFFDSPAYELSFGVRMPPQSGSGVFIDPQRVLNAASFALGYPISPGGFITVFGSGFGSQTVKAGSFPFPPQLGTVSATINGKAAPIQLVTPTQINMVVPYSTTGNTATVIVTVNGTASNSVEVPLAATAPGLFSLTQNGLGDAAVLHANYAPVTADNPAKPSEVVQLFLSGMGAVTPTVADGAAAPGTQPFALVNSPVNVTIGGLPCAVSFNGLTPLLASLYQLNIKVPANLSPGTHSLAVQTIEGFSDMVNIRVGTP
ncbi:MAG: hypothetical protein ABI995_01300 [Acidobacteriota bacterium]